MVRIKNDNPLKDLNALYNIYTISFNNIKGSASELERGRILALIDRLECRVDDLKEEYGYMKIEGLTLLRKPRAEYSQILWRSKSEDGVWRVAGLEVAVGNTMRNSLSEDHRHSIETIDEEMKILNANLKIQWTIYIEFCRLTSHQPVTPSQFKPSY